MKTDSRSMFLLASMFFLATFLAISLRALWPVWAQDSGQSANSPPQAQSVPSAAPIPLQPLPLPPWSYPLIILGVNFGMEGLKRAAPKIPAWLGPFINLGLGLGTTLLGNALGGGMASTTGLVSSTALISGTAGLTHSLAKNIIRSDTLGDKPTGYQPSP